MRLCAAPSCSEDISHKHGSARYCSLRCKDAVKRAKPGERERAAARTAAWRSLNPDQNTENVARWRAENREAYLAGQRRWQIENPDAVRLHVNNRRARECSAQSFEFTPRDWARLVARYRGCCAYCGVAGPLQIEHVVPLSRGGYSGAGNYLPACPTCNRSKGARFLSEWRYSRKGVQV